MQDAGGQRGHGHAAKAEDHGQHRAAVESEQPEQTVGEHRQTGEVAGILEQPEGDEERGHDGQDQRERVGHAHGPQAVLPDQELRQPRRVDVRLDESRDSGIEYASEQFFLHQPDQGACPEHADEFVHGEQHAEQDRPRPYPVDDPLPHPMRQQRAGVGAAPGDACGQGACRLAALVGECRRRDAVRMGSGTRAFDPGMSLVRRVAQPGLDLAVFAQIENGQAAGRETWMGPVFLDQRGNFGDGCFRRCIVVQERLDGLRVGEMTDQLRDTLAAGCDRRNDRNAERVGKAGGVDDDPTGAGLVVHVEREQAGHAEIRQQRGQGQGAAQVLGVADLDQGAQGLVQQCAQGGAFVVAARGQGEDSGRVDEFDGGIEARHGARHLDRGAGVVGNVDVCAGETVEQYGLADVRVADKGDGRRGGHAYPYKMILINK